jgi:hypothetical protein
VGREMAGEVEEAGARVGDDGADTHHIDSAAVELAGEAGLWLPACWVSAGRLGRLGMPPI